jgi:predicted DNA-binding transcriptional regulator AlpA
MRAIEPSEFLTARDLQARYGVSRMWIEHRIRESGFPKPTKFTDSVMAMRFWRLDEVEQWKRERARINEGVS